MMPGRQTQKIIVHIHHKYEKKVNFFWAHLPWVSMTRLFSMLFHDCGTLAFVYWELVRSVNHSVVPTDIPGTSKTVNVTPISQMANPNFIRQMTGGSELSDRQKQQIQDQQKVGRSSRIRGQGWGWVAELSTLHQVQQGSHGTWKSLNSREFHLLKNKALKAWNFIY